MRWRPGGGVGRGGGLPKTRRIKTKRYCKNIFFDFSQIFAPSISTRPPPSDPLYGFGPMQGERTKFVCPVGARARWSLKTCWTLTKLSESFNCITCQSPTEYKSRGEGARTPSRAPNPSRFRTDGRTNGRTERDTLKSPYAITLTLFGKATEVAIRLEISTFRIP